MEDGWLGEWRWMSKKEPLKTTNVLDAIVVLFQEREFSLVTNLYKGNGHGRNVPVVEELAG